MSEENPLEKGKQLLEFWTGKSLHHTYIGYIPKICETHSNLSVLNK